MCVLLFNANHACSAPLHVLLTETILCHGGDQVLVQIMNGIGAVASLDTSNRLATHVVQTRLVKGIKPSLIPNALTIVSVDNIDILQPHAVVSSLDATQSWHGTSIQHKTVQLPQAQQLLWSGLQMHWLQQCDIHQRANGE